MLVQGVAPQSSNDSCDLPKDLQSLVAARYHGTKIVILSDLNEDDKQLFQKEHAEGCPGLAKVDFYGEWQASTGVSADQIESGQPYHKAFGFSCLQGSESSFFCSLVFPRANASNSPERTYGGSVWESETPPSFTARKLLIVISSRTSKKPKISQFRHTYGTPVCGRMRG